MMSKVTPTAAETDSTQNQGPEQHALQKLREKRSKHRLVSISKVSADARSFEVWSLGIVIVIGGQYFSWNFGLVAGFGSFFLAVLVTGIGYLCLILCLAEMSSSMPFSGGAYGFARVTLGTYPGFIVGCFESMEYILYVATSVLIIGQLMTSSLNTPQYLEPVWWMLFHLTALPVQLYGGKYFWAFIRCTAIAITIILVGYCVLTIPIMDFEKFSTFDKSSNPWFVGGVYTFMQNLSVAAWFFVGIEALPLASEETISPKHNIPKGMVACVLTLLVTAVGVLLSAVSNPPGIEETSVAAFPLSYGYHRMTHASLTSMDWLSFPSIYATAFGFMFCYGRQMFAMARSGLFPIFMGRTFRDKGTPVSALLAGSSVSLLATLLGWYVKTIYNLLFPMCMISAYSVYLSQLMSYVILRVYYPNIPREFHNPAPRLCVCYGVLIFGFSLISILGFVSSGVYCLISTLVFWGACSAYYYFVSRSRQFFSEHEQEVLFVAYIIRANMKKARRFQKHLTSKVTVSKSPLSAAPGESTIESAALRTVYPLILVKSKHVFPHTHNQEEAKECAVTH